MGYERKYSSGIGEVLSFETKRRVEEFGWLSFGLKCSLSKNILPGHQRVKNLLSVNHSDNIAIKHC